MDHPHCIRCGHCIAVCPEEALSLGSDPGRALPGEKASDRAFESLVKARRTTRVFKDADIPKESVDRLLSLLAHSPTGTNSRALEVAVIAGRDEVRAFSGSMMGFFMGAAKVLGFPLLKPLVFIALGAKKARKALGFADRYFGRFRAGEDVLCHRAPCALLFHAPVSASTPEQDCMIAATITALHAESLGLGSCFNGFIVYGLKYAPKIRRGLGIPKDHRVYGALLLGIPDIEYRRLPPRAAVQASFPRSPIRN